MLQIIHRNPSLLQQNMFLTNCFVLTNISSTSYEKCCLNAHIKKRIERSKQIVAYNLHSLANVRWRVGARRLLDVAQISACTLHRTESTLSLLYFAAYLKSDSNALLEFLPMAIPVLKNAW